MGLRKLILDLASELTSYTFLYKLRPAEIRGNNKLYYNLNRKKIIVLNDSKQNLYELFSLSTIQTGVYSTALTEGIGFGLKTVIIKLSGYELFSTIEHPNIFFSKDLKEIIEFIKGHISINDFDIINELFQSNAMKKTTSEVLRIYAKTIK